ncbi:MAG: WecB/TagA/CpsF family glycosyltransferase [Kordiimonadaceae bacterium]|nr:WecB/TagA/CpsF family glycosyltransferase [Kordiimonadaceae bacterium]
MFEVSGLKINNFETLDHAVGSIINQDGTINEGFAVAINAEKIISMRKNKNVREILESATFRYTDGIGVVWALRKKGAICNRIPGCDLWQALMRRAGENNTKVFLVGAKPEVLEQASEKLTNEFNVALVGAQHGYFVDEDILIEKIVASGAEIVTVAMGSPTQEKFIAKCRAQHPEAFYMGVGGTYDVFVGNVSRAPEWAQKYNLEWFYRVLKQPSRVIRQTVLLEYFALLMLNKL